MTKPKLASDAAPTDAPKLTVEDSVPETKPEVKPQTVEQKPDGIIVETF